LDLDTRDPDDPEEYLAAIRSVASDYKSLPQSYVIIEATLSFEGEAHGVETKTLISRQAVIFDDEVFSARLRDDVGVLNWAQEFFRRAWWSEMSLAFISGGLQGVTIVKLIYEQVPASDLRLRKRRIRKRIKDRIRSRGRSYHVAKPVTRFRPKAKRAKLSRRKSGLPKLRLNASQTKKLAKRVTAMRAYKRRRRTLAQIKTK
jgi:hypothetical protein